MMDVIAYREEHMPIVLSDNGLKMLHDGILYVHGRDKWFRPILIFKTSILASWLQEHTQDVLDVWMYVTHYAVDHILLPGKSENWIAVNDLSNVATSRIPVKFWIEMASLLQMHLKWRAHLSFGLSVTFAIRMLWKIISPFVDK